MWKTMMRWSAVIASKKKYEIDYSSGVVNAFSSISPSPLPTVNSLAFISLPSLPQ